MSACARRTIRRTRVPDRGCVAALAVVRAATELRPEVAIVAGSGLSGLGADLVDGVRLPYAAIPGWPASTVLGHAGEFVVGRLGGVVVAVARGRTHLYEGRSAHDTTFGVRLMHALGARTLVVTNAAGGLNPDFAPGDVMVIRDHLFLPGMAGFNPLVGPNDDAVGPRFPSMLHAYAPDLRPVARRCLADAGLAVRDGVYAMVAGPSFETPAEAKYLHGIGADAVGMSTCPEVVVARHAGMRVVGLSVITNLVPIHEPHEVAGHDLHTEVLETGRVVAERLVGAVAELVRSIAGP